MTDERQMTIADVGAMEESSPRMESILLLGLRRDGGTQLRQGMDLNATQEYAEALARGEVFPPVIVFDDGEHRWLSDGFHRYDAHVLCDLKLIDCEIRQGTRQDAILWAAKANRAHGVRLTARDREKIVMTITDEFPGADQQAVAAMAGVAQGTVSGIYKRLNYQPDNSKRGRPRKTLFTCGECQESFPEPVWHCRGCDHHWLIGDDECGNCHEHERDGYTSAPLDAAVEATLSVFEEEAREGLESLLFAPGVPEDLAREAVENIAHMSDQEQSHLAKLAVSGDPVQQQAAVALMRGLPVTRPVYTRVETALGHMRLGQPEARGTAFEGAFKVVIQHLEGLLESIESDERRLQNGTA